MSEKSKSAMMVEMAEEGMKVGEIAKALDVRYQFVYNVLSQKGLVEKVEKGESKSARMEQLFVEGKSAGEIAKEMGVRYQFVYNVLRNKGLISKKS